MFTQHLYCKPNPTAMNTAIVFTLLIGILNTIYLSITAILGKNVYCFLLPDEWCLAVQHSKYSKTFGIRNPYLGLFMLTLIAVMYYMNLNDQLDYLYTFGIVTFGFLFSCYFLYIQAVLIKAFCTWCVLSFLVFTALFTELLFILYL